MASSPINRSFSSSRSALILLGVFRFSEAVAWTSIFPYVYFMVQEFSDRSQSDTAFITGLLIASFTFCEFLGSSFWAMVSDRIGRKPTLLIGATCGVITALTFGFSNSILVAVLSRVFGGLSNPNVGVIQTCVGEMVTVKADQASAFSLVSFIRSLGTLSGPIVGGNLARPQDRWPTVFRPDSVWTQFPFLFPNVIVAVLIGTTAFLGAIVLPETNPKIARRSISDHWVGRRLTHILTRIRGKNSMYTALDQQAAVEDHMLSARTDDMIELQMSSNTDRALEEVDGEPAVGSSSEFSGKTFSKKVNLQILSLSLLAFHKVSMDVLLPVFLATPTAGEWKSRGFGLSAVEIGYLLTSQAIVMTTAQLLLVPWAIKRYGLLQLYRWILVAFPILYGLVPLCAIFPRPFDVCAILPLMWCTVVSTSIGYTCCSILLTHTAPHPTRLAKVNGAGAAWSCLARSIGPLIVGPVFDFSHERALTPLPFWILAGIASVAIPQSSFLSE